MYHKTFKNLSLNWAFWFQPKARNTHCLNIFINQYITRKSYLIPNRKFKIVTLEASPWQHTFLLAFLDRKRWWDGECGQGMGIASPWLGAVSCVTKPCVFTFLCIQHCSKSPAFFKVFPSFFLPHKVVLQSFWTSWGAPSSWNVLQCKDKALSRLGTKLVQSSVIHFIWEGLVVYT